LPIDPTCSEKIAVFEEDRDDENQKDSHDQNQNYHRKHARAATLANVIHTEPEVEVSAMIPSSQYFAPCIRKSIKSLISPNSTIRQDTIGTLPIDYRLELERFN